MEFDKEKSKIISVSFIDRWTKEKKNFFAVYPLEETEGENKPTFFCLKCFETSKEGDLCLCDKCFERQLKGTNSLLYLINANGLYDNDKRSWKKTWYQFLSGLLPEKKTEKIIG